MRGVWIRPVCLLAGPALLTACVQLPPELARELEPTPIGTADHYRPVTSRGISAERGEADRDAPR